MSQRGAILIISHKEQLSSVEVQSLQQCFRLLPSVDTYIITKKSNRLDAYQQLSDSLKFYLVEDEHLNTYEAFNAFKQSASLYKDFLQYDYVLFYELDAWIFSDQLDYWMNQGYAYVAPPWFSSLNECDPNATFIGVGNGGFSLRHVAKTYSLLKRVKQVRTLNKFWKQSGINKLWAFDKFLLRFNFYFKIAKFWELPYILDEALLQEDVFICYRAASFFSDYPIATPEVALQFGFEVNPAVLYERNHRQLPFGCHAWQKYDPDFWKPFIPVETTQPIS